jgi:hypothetical protein
VTAAVQRRDYGHSACAVFLAPALYLSLWLEVIGGTGETWNTLQTGQFDLVGAVFHMGFAFAGPIAVVLATLRSRANKKHIARRLVRIEVWGLAVSCPFALLAILAMAAAAII